MARSPLWGYAVGMQVSKTNFLIYRECAHNGWVKMHRPEIYRAKPLSAFDQNIIETGNEVDAFARNLFPGGIVGERDDFERTQKLIAARSPVIYQAALATDRFVIACDILVWNTASNAYDLYEVKASTSGDDKKAKDELYTYDIGFQAAVLREAGVPLGRLYLVRLNSEYVRGELLDLAELFTKEDFSDRVASLAGALPNEMATAYQVLQREAPLSSPCECIYKGRSAHCTTFAFSNPNVPNYSVHDIARIGSSKTKLIQLI